MSESKHFTRDDVVLGRVLFEDDDFMTVEIGKRDDVTYHLQQDENGKTVGGDRFFTLIFTSGKPWELD